MKIEEFAPIPPARLKRMRWRGEHAYRVLSYSFSVRWNGELTGEHVHYVFSGFATSAKDRAESSESYNGTSVYSLLDLGPRQPRRYRLMLADEQLISSHSDSDVANHLMFQIFTRMQQHTDEFLLIHAGSVVTPRGDAVLLPGNPGSGKTTLVTGLIRAGFGFLSDEIGIVDHREGVVRPYPRALNLKEGALAIFPDLAPPADASKFSPGHRYLRAQEIRPDVIADPCEVRFVIAPRYRKGMATQVAPLSPGATLKELWTSTMNLDAWGARAVPILANVARRARGYRLVSGDLGEAVQEVMKLTGPF
jgi:hypothetical protein